ncbi:MAG: hypothetical protein WAL75_02810 [Terracidiphilus sp.]
MKTLILHRFVKNEASVDHYGKRAVHTAGCITAPVPIIRVETMRTGFLAR